MIENTHLLSGGVASGIVGIIYGLVRLVTWLVKKNPSPADEPISSNQSLTQHLEAIKTPLNQHLDTLHQISIYIIEDKIQQEYLRRGVQDIKSGQDVLNSRIPELVASQQRLVDRIADLIQRLDHSFENVPGRS